MEIRNFSETAKTRRFKVRGWNPWNWPAEVFFGRPPLECSGAGEGWGAVGCGGGGVRGWWSGGSYFRITTGASHCSLHVNFRPLKESMAQQFHCLLGQPHFTRMYIGFVFRPRPTEGCNGSEREQGLPWTARWSGSSRLLRIAWGAWASWH